jgi:phosphomannomutase
MSQKSNEPIISVSGLRGIIGDTLTPDTAMHYVAAFLAGFEQPGRIVLTRDGRTSGPMLVCAIGSVIQACGFEVVYGDVAATPTTGILVRELRALGGIQVTASHNPTSYNGLKLFGNDGRVIAATMGEQVRDRYRKREANYVPVESLGSWNNHQDTVTAHLQRVLNTVDRKRIQERKFKVVLDSNHGSGSVVGRHLLAELGCEFELLGDMPNGHFAHPPEPTAANLQWVTTKAHSFHADVVFCQDPDADRLAIIDERGDYIGEEYTLALALEHVLSESKEKNPVVVTNCSSSRMACDIAQRHNASCVVSAVGEANVADLMIERKAVYGGEGNGGTIDPRVGYVRDSFVAMAQVLDLMAARKQSITELVKSLPRYEIHKATISMANESVPKLQQALAREFSDARSNHQDGLRLDWDDAWLLVRPSNTEPIVRAVAEAPTRDRAKQLCDRAAEIAASL